MLLVWGYPGASTCGVPSPVPPVPEQFLLCAPYVLDVLFLESIRADTTTCSLQFTVLVICSAETKAVLANHILKILQPAPETPWMLVLFAHHVNEKVAKSVFFKLSIKSLHCPKSPNLQTMWNKGFKIQASCNRSYIALISMLLNLRQFIFLVGWRAGGLQRVAMLEPPCWVPPGSSSSAPGLHGGSPKHRWEISALPQG